MSLQISSDVVSSYASSTNSTSKANAKTEEAKTSKAATETAAKDTDGVSYEKSEETSAKDNANTIYNKDAIVAKLQADQQSRLESMQNLVSKLLGKQVDLFTLASEDSPLNLAEKFKEAASKADEETINEAKKSISEDGYWGVNQTSDRLVSFAIALSGGDTSKADELMGAIEKGYELATKAWGEDLPEICQKTLDATRQKMTDWKEGRTTAADYSNYLNQ